MSFFKKNETGVIGEDKQYEHAENEDFCGSVRLLFNLI